MRNIFRFITAFIFCLLISRLGYTEEFKFGQFKGTESIKSTAAGCAAPSGFRFLHVNNVRGRINTGGDMWWDLPGGVGAQYFVPAAGSATSLFSGSLWIGGLDINNQLKLAALRYRQVGQDYWTGPLTVDGTAAVDEETCAKYDKHFVIKRAEVEEFVNWYNSENKEEEFPGYSIPTSILEYPAHGDVAKNQSYYLAPFYDVDGDGNYDPGNGDYPYYDFDNELCPLNYAGDPNYVPTPTMESEYYPNAQTSIDFYGGLLVDQVLKGDETFWWVFNDKGNFHTETNGSAIGIEIRAQAFAFSTNDEINNMTFYSYEIINRSTYELTNTYFSPWVDTDLGYAWDDFVGCDVERGLGYCYNGVEVDGGGEPEAYGAQPPAIGIDFFQGPYLDPNGYDNPAYRGDGLLGPSFDGDCSIVSLDSTVISMTYGADNELSGQFLVLSAAINGVNFGNGIVDDERYGMRRFVYHNNSQGIQGDPQIAVEYYNYLRGFWRDNSRMQYGGNAHLSSGALGPDCDFMFPGDSDPCNWGTHGQFPNGGFNQNGFYWTEETVGNKEDDRRFMQSAGPFTLKSGAVNYITVGMPWARAISGGPWASVELLRVVDDKCQALFDNCFKVIDGPTAPDLTFREMDQELLVYISNSKNSNNYLEGYTELDAKIRALSPDYDPYYRFEGYQIYQLRNSKVSLSESKHDPDKVRLVAQYDINNGVGKVVNFYYDQFIGANVPVVEVNGSDNGIVHAFSITEDRFATGDRRLVNHKQYYFSVIAYGYNNYKTYDQTLPTALDGQKEPYLSGRKNVQVYTAIPHKPVNGTMANASFGDGPQITRIEGQGNGGMSLELSEETIMEILSKNPAITPADTLGSPTYPIAYRATYKYGRGPVNVKVIDPLNIKKGTFTLKIDTLYNVTFYEVTGQTITGDSVVSTTGRWRLIDNNTGEVYHSETELHMPNEQLFPELGISIQMNQVFEPGPYAIGQTIESTPSTVYNVFADKNGFIESYTEYADSSRRWLAGVEDNDIPGDPQNWIRAGDYQDQQNGLFNDYNMPSNPLDTDEFYEKIEAGTWAPHVLCTAHHQDENGPVFSAGNKPAKEERDIRNIASVDIVITPDKSKWTRSPVIEMSPDPLLAEGNAKRFSLRRSPSLDINGNPAKATDTVPSMDINDPHFLSSYGMSWFPGYAINVESGERLNIIFGEDSWLVNENGRDMLFNPSPNLYESPSENVLFGGKHYVYIMGHTIIDKPANDIRINFPAYDGGKELIRWIEYDTIPIIQDIFKTFAFQSTMYVGMPLAVRGEEWLSNEVKIKIRIAKPYKRHYSTPLDVIPDHLTQNNSYPMYEFTTDGIATSYNVAEKKKTDLDLIGVVPNPYYAYSGYESAPLDNRVRIIYLPERCVVTIYNVSGTLIRRFTKDDPVTFIDWDLKNQAGIPIAGGIYLVHVQSDEGEKIVKWFGSLRIEDFNQF